MPGRPARVAGGLTADGLTAGRRLPTLSQMASVAEWWQKETFIPQPDWAPPTAPVVARRRRWPRRLAASVILVLLAAVGVLASVAWHYDRSAARWRALEQRQELAVARSQTQLDLSQSSTRQLEACITALQKSHPGFVAMILGQSAKVPAVCKTAEAIAGGAQS